MSQNAPTSIYYYVFYFGAEHRMTYWDMLTFFEDSTFNTLSTVMHVTKEVFMDNGTGYLIPIYDRDLPITLGETTILSRHPLVDFRDCMYMHYFNDVYGENFIPNNIDEILPTSSEAIAP
jgi:hypothetical protein